MAKTKSAANSNTNQLGIEAELFKAVELDAAIAANLKQLGFGD